MYYYYSMKYILLYNNNTFLSLISWSLIKLFVMKTTVSDIQICGKLKNERLVDVLYLLHFD